MSDDVELSDGTYAPIQDTVCECGHSYDEHGPSGKGPAFATVASYLMCRAAGCGCVSFLADPDRSTADAIVARGGDPYAWPEHARRPHVLHALRDRVVGEGCPVTSCEVAGDGLDVEFGGWVYRLEVVRVVDA